MVREDGRTLQGGVDLLVDKSLANPADVARRIDEEVLSRLPTTLFRGTQTVHLTTTPLPDNARGNYHLDLRMCRIHVDETMFQGGSPPPRVRSTIIHELAHGITMTDLEIKVISHGAIILDQVGKHPRDRFEELLSGGASYRASNMLEAIADAIAGLRGLLPLPPQPLSLFAGLNVGSIAIPPAGRHMDAVARIAVLGEEAVQQAHTQILNQLHGRG